MNAFSRISRCLLGTRDFQPAVLTWTHFVQFRAVGTSRYTGVHWNVQSAKWRSEIRWADRWKSLGFLTDEVSPAGTEAESAKVATIIEFSDS